MPMKRSKNPFLTVRGRKIGLDHPTYFIADIAANHNGSLEEAKTLISLAKESGADAAKFQHFRADRIVSRYGFESQGEQRSHQSRWKKSVYQVYEEASVPWEWTPLLKAHADKVGIHFFSAPYDFEAIEMLDNYVPAYKIGSGDLNWSEAVKRIAKKKKPVFLATGASTMREVKQAVASILRHNDKLCLMQCNTNYTGSLENFRYIQLNVLKTYAKRFPNVVLGLSDHTPGHATVLGAVTLGARAIEKHFTRSRKQEGPDHAFSMEPRDWRDMVDRTRELELALGEGRKKVEDNEKDTVWIQRRCCRAARDLKKGVRLTRADISVLRPAAPGASAPDDAPKLVGRKTKRAVVKGEAFSRRIV